MKVENCVVGEGERKGRERGKRGGKEGEERGKEGVDVPPDIFLILAPAPKGKRRGKGEKWESDER
jgi:hypothetical protein